MFLHILTVILMYYVYCNKIIVIVIVIKQPAILNNHCFYPASVQSINI